MRQEYRDHAKKVEYEAYFAVKGYTPWKVLGSYWTLIVDPGAPNKKHGGPPQFSVSDETVRSLRNSVFVTGEPVPVPTEPPPTVEQMIEDQGYSGPTLNLSKNFPMFWRPLTAIIDVFTRLYFSHGVIGFLVAVVQLVIGGGLMYLLIKKTQQQWLQHPIVFLPGAIVLGSLVAIPIWLFTLLVFNTIGTYLWLAGGMAELVSSFFALSWVALKVFEFLGHEAIVKRLTKLFGH